MPVYAIKAKAALLDHHYYCVRQCGWTGDIVDVNKLQRSTAGHRSLQILLARHRWTTDTAEIIR